MTGDDRTTLQIQGVYNTLYSARTRPEFKFMVTRYFIDEWVPILGPSLAWLIVGLRQQCFWNRRRDWCIVDKATLAQETALDERTIDRSLKKPFGRWFVVDISHRYRYLHQLGKKVRAKNRYQLLLDEPLTPRHQLGLSALLRRLKPAATSDPLATALEIVQALLDLPDLTGKIAYTGSIPRNLPRRTVLELVEESLELPLANHAADERTVVLDQRCTDLYHRIVQPNKIYVGWQYFRLEWVPLLGHALAWLVIYLRRRCFWDEQSNELRDTFTTYKKDLAAAIGQSTRNLANLMENPYTCLFITPADDINDETGRPPTATRNQPTHYRVRMTDEPLTPADRQQVAEALRQRLQEDYYDQNPENGQLNMFPILQKLSNRQTFAYGQLPEKMPDRERKESRLETEPSEKTPQHVDPATGKNVATIKDSLGLSELREVQQQLIPAAASNKGLQIMLDDLAVQEPARSKLLADSSVTVTTVGAWFLYAETQPGIRDPRSYVIKRLLANDPPPVEFVTFARLDDETWSLFEATARSLRTGQPLQTGLTPEGLDIFVHWADIYADLEPAETQRLLRRQEQAAREAEEPDLGGVESPLPVDPARQTAHRLWQTALDQLRQQMARQTFDSWLKPTEVLDYREDVFTIDARSIYAKEWLENRLAGSIEKVLTAVVGRSTTVRFTLTGKNSDS